MKRGEFKDSNLVAVYGTLRPGNGNFSRILKPEFDCGVEYVGKTTVEGFRMVSLGGFPAIIPSDNKSDTVVVDVFSIPEDNRRVKLALDALEGYQDEENHWYNRVLIDTEYGEAYIYVFDSKELIGLYGDREIVPNGDWNRFIGMTSQSTYIV